MQSVHFYLHTRLVIAYARARFVENRQNRAEPNKNKLLFFRRQYEHVPLISMSKECSLFKVTAICFVCGRELLWTGEREREKERGLKVWYIALAHRQAWCFANCLVYFGSYQKIEYIWGSCWFLREEREKETFREIKNQEARQTNNLINLQTTHRIGHNTHRIRFCLFVVFWVYLFCFCFFLLGGGMWRGWGAGGFFGFSCLFALEGWWLPITYISRVHVCTMCLLSD